MTEVAELTAGLKPYFVNAWASDRKSLFMNIFAESHQDALDRVIEYWTRNPRQAWLRDWAAQNNIDIQGMDQDDLRYAVSDDRHDLYLESGSI